MKLQAVLWFKIEFWRGTYLALAGGCRIRPSVSGVVRPVCKRHRSMAKWRAALTTKRFLARLLLTSSAANWRTGREEGCHLSKRQTISTRFQRTAALPQRLIEPSLARPSLE